MNNSFVLVHARNVTGLGASLVVESIINSLENNNKKLVLVYSLPKHFFSFSGNKIKIKFNFISHLLPNSLFRFIECLFPRVFYPEFKNNIVLGDIPLRGLKNQLLFVHQQNLIIPKYNSSSSNKLKFVIMRTLFTWNIKHVKQIFVQSDVMANDLIKSYNIPREIVNVLPHPSPSYIKRLPFRKKNIKVDKLCLFYPSAGYPHKNHKIISQLILNKEKIHNIKEIILTLDNKEYVSLFPETSLINNIGRVSPKVCLEYYGRVDALIFPSVAESYGLPLLEAMIIGLPIICSDLPFSHWLCGEEAIYFNPYKVESLTNSICELKSKLNNGWYPSWNSSLQKIPNSWDVVAKKIIKLL
jgi:glycosyltransferase involved in cell wall biosynthesis